MSKKKDLEKAIQESENEIEQLEKKRIRSQSALLDAFLNNTMPVYADVHFNRISSGLMVIERENLRKLTEELNKLG